MERLKSNYVLMQKKRVRAASHAILNDVPYFQAILSEGGLYAFQILAREIADDGSFGDSATTDVTIVVTDQGLIWQLL